MKIIARTFLAITLTAFFLFGASSVYAEGEFRTDVNVSYNIKETGIAQVVNSVTLENLYTDLYATTYTLVLDHIKPENIHAYDAKGSLKTEIERQGSKTNISVSFNDIVVGKGKTRVFNVVYDDLEVASRTGEVWEISIPKLTTGTTFTSYNLTFSVPVTFGLEAYISPNPIKKEAREGFRYYEFDKRSVEKTGVTAGFGEFQVFSFSLVYHLENPLVKTGKIEIAIPPDTSLQKVYYDSFTPSPDNIKRDDDGNWLATYTLSPRKRVDVTAKGYVQIFSSPVLFGKTSQTTLNSNLKPSIYWQSDNSTITALATNLKTPKNIYDFVVSQLTYDFDRAKPNVVRLGAVEALNQPQNAICMEFTDLFVALCRAAGIPAREINGFAYTENPKIQPLSLVSDVLHSWPEYWDSDKNIWVPVDPTWGSTTGGIDFFNKLDLRHFAFVIHGADPQKPYPPGSYKLGPSPQKDVFVNFSQLPEKRSPQIEISYSFGRFLPFLPQKIKVNVTNKGLAAAYDMPISEYFDGIIKNSYNIEFLPPFGKYSFETQIPFSFLGTKTPQNIVISAGEADINILTNKRSVIVYNLIGIFIIILIILVTILIRLRKIKFDKIVVNVKKIFKRSS